MWERISNLLDPVDITIDDFSTLAEVDSVSSSAGMFLGYIIETNLLLKQEQLSILY